ncbi:MAG: hypothetical protein R3C56_18990 [Pirellulaceae bacterium]
MSALIVVQRQPQLLQVVAALHAARCFASSLNGRQKQSNQDADDGYDDEEFYQGKAT